MAKKEKKEKSKKIKKERKPSYLKEVGKEMKQVKFPTGKEVLTYTLATIAIVLFLVIFFLLLSALLSWVKGAI